jgi:hypothetical protein
MQPRGGAGTNVRFGDRSRRTLAAAVTVLLLSVQVGLTFHGAAHIHEVDQAGDCNLCDLGSHFVAEPVPVPDLETLPLMAIYLPREPLSCPDTALQTPLARGPPPTSG